MIHKGENIIGNGHCLACGIRLKAGDLCFDCLNLAETKEETFKRVIGVQQSLLERGNENTALEPKEGEDYYYQEEIIAEVCGTGSFIVFADENADSSIMDAFWESGGSLSDIDLDIDIVHTEKTGRVRMMDFNGKPFNRKDWLREKLTKSASTPDENFHQRKLIEVA